MTTDPPISSARSTSTTRRTKVLLVVILVMGALLGWEYRILNFHDASLTRLQSELERRKTLQVPLKRDEVASLLTGSPIQQTDSGGDGGGVITDYYAWRGLIHHSYISVETGPTGEVVKVENSLFGGTDIVLHDEAATAKALALDRAITPEKVASALQRADTMLWNPQVNEWLMEPRESISTTEFDTHLRSVFEGLPELKVSTVKGELKWNTIRIPRKERGLFAFRFTVPFDDPAVLDYVRMASGQTARVISRSEHTRDYINLEMFRDARSRDIEHNVDVEGLGRLESAVSGSQSLKGDRPEKDFIAWFFMTPQDPHPDFELKTVLFVSKADEAPMRRGFQEVSNFIGLRTTSVPKFEATPQGTHDALIAFDQRMRSDACLTATCGRILRPIKSSLPEVTINTKTGQTHWQKLESPNGNCTAVRIRIPESIAGRADLYGAFLGTESGRFGWDCSDRHDSDLKLRIVDGVPQREPLPASHNHLTLFSHTDGVVESGEEVVLWFQHERSSPSHEPVFVTLTAVPHGEPNSEYATRKIKAKQAWLCGKLLGVNVPLPDSPEGSTVLGTHDRKIGFLKFTPDSRRLLSFDDGFQVNVWDLETLQLEGQIGLPLIDMFLSGMVSVTPNGKWLLVFDNFRRLVLRWNLDSREPASALDGLTSHNERLQGAAFGPQPHQLLLAINQYRSAFNSQLRFVTRDLNTGETVEHSKVELSETAALAFIPTTNMFALGLTRVLSTGDTNVPQRFRAVVQLHSADFNTRIQEFLLGEEPPQFQAQDRIPVRLSYQPGGRRLAAICESGHLKVWDIGTGTELLSKTLLNQPEWKPQMRIGFNGETIGGRSTPYFDVSLSADGETVAAVSSGHEYYMRWNVSNGQHDLAWHADDVPMTHLIHSPDGKWVATGNAAGVVRLWKNSK